MAASNPRACATGGSVCDKAFPATPGGQACTCTCDSVECAAHPLTPVQAH